MSPRLPQNPVAALAMPFHAVPAADCIHLKGAANTPEAPRPSAVSPFQALDAAVPTVRQTADAVSAPFLNGQVTAERMPPPRLFKPSHTQRTVFSIPCSARLSTLPGRARTPSIPLASVLRTAAPEAVRSDNGPVSASEKGSSLRSHPRAFLSISNG